MKQHQREFFISRIRLGFLNIDDLTIKPITLEQKLHSEDIYYRTYEDCLDDDILTSDEMEGWMYEQDIWDHEDAADMKRFTKDIEDIKVKMFENRTLKRDVATLRHNLRNKESKLIEKLKKKNMYYQNTCEGLSDTAKLHWVIENTTFKKSKRYDFVDKSIDFVISKYIESHLNDNDVRDLALSDSWKSVWNLKDSSSFKLFHNLPEYEMTHNQKALLTWAKLYDNIQESMDVPEDSAIKDHDMLDGWFTIQSRKRERERLQQESESKGNSKINNSSEVLVMSSTREEAQKTRILNDEQGQNIVKQRFNTIRETLKEKDEVHQTDFLDERLDLQRKSQQAFKDKFNK